MISTTGPIGSADQLKDLSASDPTGAQGESGFMDMLLQALLGGQLSAEELRGWLEERGYTSEDAAAFIQSLGLPLPEGEGLGGATVDNDLASIQQETPVAWDALEEADAEALLHALQGRLDPIADGSQRPGEADIAANLLRALMAARGAGTGESAPENRESVNLDQQLAQQRRNAWLAGDIEANWQASSQSGFGQTVGDVLAADALRTAALTEAQAQRSALDANFLAQIQQRAVRDAPPPLLQEQSEAAALQAAREAGANLVSASGRPGGVPTYNLPTPFQQPDWGRAMGERLTTLVRDGIQQARIHLNPPHLGPVDIFVTVNDDRAQVQMAAQQAVTREALEAEMPRLRAMLSDSGFSSVDVGVSQQGEGRDSAPARSPFETLFGSDDTSAEDNQNESGTGRAVREPRGLVDHYV